MKQYIYISLVCALTFLSAGIQAQDANGILYVKKGGSGTGASWASPLGELADALKAATQLNAATAGTVKQIWVAAGTYLPMYPADAVTTGAATTTNRNNAFVVVNNVKIYGGFAGTETALTGRDSSRTTNQTILSGNLGGTGVNTDNAYRVVVATGALGNAEINSCIIREGNGGAFNIINVNGIDIVSSSGGGIVCKGSSGLLTSFVIANVSITDNRSNTGGGMYGQYAAPVLRNVIINENEAFQDGGGVYYTDAAPVLNKVIISGNIANSRGGGVYTSYSSPSFTNVLVSGNKANNSHGGGMYTLAPSISPVLTNVTIAGNLAGGDGGGAYALGAIPAIYNSIVYGNNGSPNAGVSPALIPSATCQYNLLQGVSASTGYHVLDGNTVDPLFRGASTATPPFTGGNYRLQSNSPAKDAGNDALYTATSGYSTTDVAGQPRFNGAIDLGAYEAQPLTAQTITVLADTTVTYGNVFTRAFSASSGLGVAVSSADNNIAEAYQDATDGNAWKIMAKKAGTVNITLSQAGNDSYAAASDVVFALTISKAALTVTAKDSTMNYSGVAFAGGNGVTYSGWVNGDDSTAALTGALTYSGTSQSATGAGIYTTIPGGLTSGNYTITYVSGKLNIILTAGANGILYVKKGSTGNGSGWTNAVGEVADALRAAAVMNGIAAGSVKQIWVAKGTYLPAYPVTAATTGAASNGNSFNSFVLVKDTKLYGGFAGNETDTAGRDFTVNTTILSGNIGDIGSRSDNAFRVVVAAGDMGEAVISGFTISDSYSTISDNIIVNGVKTDNGLGGGITVRSASLLIEDVTLTNNTNINGAAAAVYSEAGAAMANATFRRVNIFRNSSLTGGGGLYATYANVQLENVTGSFNNANATGGMFVLSQSATVHCRQSSFNDNRTRHLGGAIYCSGNAMALFYQCEFLRDTCSSSGGAFHIAGTSSIQFKNCAMEACVSSAYGAVGHINSSGAVVKILNSRVIGSYQPANTGVLLLDNGTLDVVNSTISGNKSIAVSGVSGTTIHIFNSIIYGNGGGVSASGNYNAMYSTIQGATADATEHITNADPLFVNSNNYNTAPFAGGDYRLQPTSPVVNGGYDSIYHANDTVTTDLAGNSRLMGTAIDQGAYELQLLPQSITALADTTATYGDVFSRIFSASSGLAVTVASEDNSIAEPYQDATVGNVWKIKTKKAGAVNITVSQPGNASYSAAADVVFALTIDKAALTVTAKDTTISYTGVGFAGGNGLSYSGFVNNEDSAAALTGAVTYSGTSQGAKNANTYVVTPAGLSAANYAITYADGTLIIDKAALTVTAKDSSKVYDGLAYSGGNGISYSGFINSEDSAAALTGTVTYSGTSQGARNVNTYVITPGGLAAANYAITYADGTLTIDKAALTVTAKDSSKVYDGLAYSGGNGLSYSGFVNSEDSAAALTGTVTYSGTSQGAKDVNGYVIIPGGLSAANYAITYANGTLTIDKAALTVTAKDSSKVYDGLVYNGGNGLSYSGFVNSEDSAAALTGTVTYSGTSQGAKNVNGYTIIPGGLSASNYAITYANGTLTIDKAALTVTAKDSSKLYDGLVYGGGNGVSYSGFVNSEDSTAALTGTVNYSGTSQGAKNVNIYVITPGGLSAVNYAITYADGTLMIDKAALTITASDSSKVYDGLVYNGGNGLSYSGFVNGEDSAAALTGAVTYSGTSQGAKNVNTYVITPGGMSAVNYAVTYADGTLTIGKAALTITANDSTKTYDGLVYNGGNGLSYSGFVNNEDSTAALTDTVTYSGTSQGAKNVNTYVITPGGLSASNYAITYANGTLTIDKAALTVTAKDSTKTYDGLAYNGGNGLSYSGFVNNEDSTAALRGTVTYSGTSQGAKNVNTYVITPGGLSAANYAISYADGTLTIDKAALTITAKDSTKTYNGLAYSGGNGLSYNGFVNSEDSTAALTGAVTYSGTSQGAKNVNAYVITPGGLSAANYAITYADGTLTIDKAALTVTANDSSKVYDGLAYSGGNGLSYSGFMNSEDSAAALTGTVTYSGTSQGAKNVNTYVIMPGGLSAANYDINYTDGTLTIDKAALTITAKDCTKTYDGLAYSGGNGLSYRGFVNGEDSTAALTGVVTYAGTSQGAENVNKYEITPGGITADNYAITYINGALTINKALVTIAAVDTARCYGITNPVFRITYSGLAGNETESVFTSAAQASTTANAQSAAGTYPVTVAGAAAGNYSFAYTNGALTVNALPVSTINAAEGAVLCGAYGTRVLSASGNYSFGWLFNNTAVQGNTTDTILVSATGTYTAIATDNNGCVAPATNSVVVTRLLPAQPAFSYDSYCAGTAIRFNNETNATNSGAVSYYWNSGNGQNSGDVAPRFTYNETGNYTAALTVTPDACPSLAVTVTKVIPVEAAVVGVQLATVGTTAGLPTALGARQLTNASYSWSPAAGLSNTGIYNPVATLNANQTYHIRMDFPSGCITVDTLQVTVLNISTVLVPNVFTPNGDGQNDVLYANLRGVKRLNYFRVFNRWGKKLFETADVSKGWDGRVNGELQPLATFIWTAEGIDENGRTIHRQGSFTLLR